MRPAASPPSRQAPLLAWDPRGVLASREVLRAMRARVFDAVRRCCQGERAVVPMPAPITRADLQAVVDEIDEKYHLVGIELHFERHDGTLRAIFEPAVP